MRKGKKLAGISVLIKPGSKQQPINDSYENKTQQN
jgi:hypothetical protein